MNRKDYHMIDLVFSIALFLFFAASVIVVLALSANIYHSSVNSLADNFTSRTAYAYVMEKIRQNDLNGGIAIGNIDGTPVLELKSNGGFTTYIYEYDDKLKELQMMDGVNASLENGTDITDVNKFEMEELENGAFRITFESDKGDEYAFVAAKRSES